MATTDTFHERRAHHGTADYFGGNFPGGSSVGARPSADNDSYGETQTAGPTLGETLGRCLPIDPNWDARLQAALTYVHRHLGDPISVRELIAEVGVSRRWLENAFRNGIGITPYQYIRSRRLEFARQLLSREPESKISRIARLTGFASAKQMTTAFRQEFGVSPREYRRTHTGS